MGSAPAGSVWRATETKQRTLCQPTLDRNPLYDAGKLFNQTRRRPLCAFQQACDTLQARCEWTRNEIISSRTEQAEAVQDRDAGTGTYQLAGEIRLRRLDGEAQA